MKRILPALLALLLLFTVPAFARGPRKNDPACADAVTCTAESPRRADCPYRAPESDTSDAEKTAPVCPNPGRRHHNGQGRHNGQGQCAGRRCGN